MEIQAQFSTIYEQLSDAVFRFCLIRTSDREVALDLTQETFSRVWQSLVKGSEMTNARAFIFTIAQRLIIDWYRKKKSLSLESLTDSEEHAFDPVDERELEQLQVGAEGRFLLGLVSKIQPAYREAVYLRFVEGLNPQDIAEVLGITANAASVRINRGLHELRQLGHYDETENSKKH